MARLGDSVTYGNHSITGDMDVGGNVDIMGSLNVGGVLFQEPSITLTGDVSGSGTVSGGSVSISVTVANDSHTHDGRYFTESESDARYYTKSTADGRYLGISAKAADSNLLDGLDSSQFLRSDATDRFNCNGNLLEFDYDTAGRNSIAFLKNGVRLWHFWHTGDDFDIERAAGTGKLRTNGNEIWHAGNFNPASKLDATAKAADSDLLDGVDSNLYMRRDTSSTHYHDIVWATTARDHGVFGTYDSAKTQHIWSMGTAYRNAADGTNFGTLYGLAYKHTNNTTGGTMAGSHQMVWCHNGNPQAALGSNIWTSGDVLAFSDRRVKTNVEVIEDALNKVKKLNGYTFDRIDKKEIGRQTGVIAQEVMAVLPEAVRGDEDHYSVAYGNMVGLLIEAVKELSEKVDRIGG